jgi:hypothetical protein
VQEEEDDVSVFLATKEHKTAVKVVKESLQAIVLIHVFDASKIDDHKIYNAAVSNEGHHHYVISGCVVHPIGYVVTTNDTFPEAYSRIIISVDSEKRRNTVNSGMIITKDDYEAIVVKKIPELNIVVLKINTQLDLSFKYLELCQPNQNELQSLGVSFTVGKTVGERFISPRRISNDKNSFQICAYPVEKIAIDKNNGARVLVLENKIMRSCIFPENAGGALINNKRQLLGIIDYKASVETLFSQNIVILADVVKKALGMAFLSLTTTPPKTSFGCNFIETSEAINSSKNIGKIFSKLNSNKIQGAYVESVLKDSIADQCGIIPGDIVLKFNNEPVTSVSVMKNLLNKSIGEGRVVLSIIRGKSIIEIECFL